MTIPRVTVEACLTRLEQAERELVALQDLAALIHVSFAIDCLRARHGLPERAPDPATLDAALHSIGSAPR